MRTNTFALALFCAALAQAACAPANKQLAENNAAADAQPNANHHAQKERLPPLPEGSSARAYFERGLDAYKKNYDEDAVESFERVVQMEPDNAEAHYRLGLAYAAVGKSGEAEKSFERAVRLYTKETKEGPDDAEEEFNLGQAYGKLGKYADAIKAYKRAIKDAPDDSDKYYELGLAYSKLAQYKEAVAALNKAVELDPNNFRAADALERARADLERRTDFLKQSEQQKRARANSNTNAKAAPSPSPKSP
jgi:tetratricopeptide (TPR) repeat protein